MKSWIFLIVFTVVLIAAYIWLFVWSRRRQKRFDEQYSAARERHDVFVLNKKVVRERPQSGVLKFIKFKTYQVVGRVNVSQAVKGVTMTRMQTMTFHTTKDEFAKIQQNHRYKMDIAGNYIGNVLAAPPVKKKSSGGAVAATGAKVRGLFSRKKAGTENIKAGKSNKKAK